MLDIAGLDRATVIQALYAASRPLGLGFLHYDPEPLPREDAERFVGMLLDYVRGRVMKIRISADSDEFDERLYDRDNGAGAAAAVIEAVRASDPARVTAGLHARGIHEAAVDARHELGTPDVLSTEGEIATFSLGLPNDPRLREAIDRADHS